MPIPTEPIGSIPRPLRLIKAVTARDGVDPTLEPLYEEAIRDTIERFADTGSPVITDGEQRKYHNFWTYCVHGLPNMAPDGFKIPFAAGHTRRMPRLTAGPFRYMRYADSYLDMALRYARLPVKQAVISPSALSLLYPADAIPGYSRQEFIQDLLHEHETEIRRCLDKGAYKVQIDFTEGRLAVKIDPSGNLLRSFIELNNLALSRFSAADRRRLGVHTCPGGDRDSTHSADVDYAELLPSLLELQVGNFYIALAGEKDRVRVLKVIRDNLKPGQRIFVGVVAPIDPRVETPEEVRDRTLEAAQYIPVEQLGTTDDCGFAPFCDDTSTSRDTAFEKVRAHVLGTALAAAVLGGGYRRWFMAHEEEEKLLHSVALQNTKSILLARQRAEQNLVQATDALEQKTQELAHSLAMMRATLESATDGILATDNAGKVTAFNRRYVEMWRMPPEALDSGEHSRLLEIASRQCDDPARFLAKATDIYASSPAESFDLLELTGGRVFERFSNIQFVDGRNVGRVWSFRDITERRQRSQEFLLSVLANSIDAIITCDERSLILSFNREAERMFGYAASEAVGQGLTILMPEPYRSEYDGCFANYLRTGQAGIIGIGREVVGRRKDGSTFPADLRVSEFFLNDRRHFNGVVRDITERKKLEEQLRQSQKMEAVGQLAGGIAHDFNNLLTIICGCSELLMLKLPRSDPNRELLASVLHAGGQATALTRQLLAFSRKQVLEPKVLDLNDVVNGFEKMVRRLIGEDIRLTTVLDPTIRPVKADPGQLEQVLINLALNARDAMPQGGSLTIETRNAELDEHFCRQHAGFQAGRYVMLSATDTGSGMTPEIQSHIFEPFFTTKEVGKGTGLGLSMVYGIVKQSDGYISVYSEPGVGTSFKVYLPHIQEMPPSDNSLHGDLARPLGHETILLAEDEKGVRHLAQTVLQACGYAVLAAADGSEAIRLAESHEGPIHLLISDVVMPQVSGHVVAEHVAALKPGIKVLFVSGYTDDAVIRHGIVQAKTPFLQKPFSTSQLAQKVREVLDKQG